MNKTKTILAVAGGVIGLAVLVMAYFTWDAFSRKSAAFEGDEENEGLKTYVNRVSTLLGKKPYPSIANKTRLEANRKSVDEWHAAMWRYAGSGDWCAPADVTPALFKETIVRDARRLAGLPGQANGKLMKPDFTFGPFKDYLADKLPAKDEMPRLQRQWYDITSLCMLLATNGVSQIADLKVVDRADAAAAEEKKAAKSAAKKRTGAKAPVIRQPSVETYKVTFQSDPAAFVSVIRLLSTGERFTIVDGFTFSHVRDAIAESLGGGNEKKDAPQASSSRRRRGRRASDAEELQAVEPEKKSSVVFNPESDSTLQVELTVSVCDFRTLEEDKEGAK